MAADKKRNIQKFIPMKFHYLSLMMKYEEKIGVMYVWPQMNG